MLGFLLVDKPKGINSFRVVSALRKVCKIRRMGYAGTLDPLANGLMIVAIGEATKLLSLLEKKDKVYEVMIFLGATSATYDAEGPFELVENAQKVERSLIETLLKDHFSGEKLQKPPAYSAVQIDGKRAYALARKGIKVDLKMRKVTFFEITLNRYSWPYLSCTVHCSSGTYIRSFAHDLGQMLGCGAYIQDLRRLKIGHYAVKDAVKLEDITPQNIHRLILKPEEFLQDFPQVAIDEADYRTLADGGYIANRGEYASGPILALYQGNCVGIVETVNDRKYLKFAKKINLEASGEVSEPSELSPDKLL